MGLLMVFPNPRRKRKTMAHRRKRKMSVKQSKYFGSGRKRRHGGGGKRRGGRSGGSTQTAGTTNIEVASNPRRRRRRRRNPFPKAFRNPVRRNPIHRHDITGVLKPAAIGAAGAVAADYLANFVAPYLPTSLTQASTFMGPLIKIALSFGVGWGVGKVAGKEAGHEAAIGGTLVALYGLLSPMTQQVTGGYGFGLGGQYGTGAGLFGQTANAPLARYVGFVRRNALGGPGPFGPMRAGPNLGATSTNQTRMRLMRGGQLGYVGPARTMQVGRNALGRYVK
jgi:hypothetical protein